MRLEERITDLKEDIIKSTQEIIRIKSVKAEPDGDMPFGKGVNDCLNYALSLCESFGFKTKNVDNYAGYGEIGEGSEMIGILVHLDVVPEGDNWTYPPYEAKIHDDKIYGRGTIDDKGPAISAIYAMKAIKDSGIPLNKRIRIIFGTDEESGWEGINYYLEREEVPTMAFTPDADFPAIHGEKGILMFDLVKKINRECRVTKIKGGNRPNMVPDYAEAHVKDLDLNLVYEYGKNNNIKIDAGKEGDTTIVKFYGVSAHGSLPESGDNAISKLMVFLDTLDMNDEVGQFINFYKDKIGMEYYGQSIGCGFEDKESGKLIFNVGVIDFSDDEIKVSVNVRYPVTYEKDAIYDGMKSVTNTYDIDIVETDYMAPIYMPKDHALIERLMKVYREETGDNREPITIGGGTYARSMENAVAFGPLFPGQVELAHQKDEYIGIDHLMKMTVIYTKALAELLK
ncbi:dipeptidase PepV [Anaeromicrobium sediminis]|uniref:Dipeptidase PepV n=1 Tax=Anaeromicrobium sediminis TaxID=1478221 RepID=A0A267MI70_9FIRM|nr:dipeptidase PepV [Anaeromicrobium sediminis]PAB58628.1 dipeptidase PepV [Anaeromicrobium sediminis]